MNIQISDSLFLTTNNFDVPGRKVITTSLEFITELEAKNFAQGINGGHFKNYASPNIHLNTAKDSLFSAMVKLESDTNSEKLGNKALSRKRFTIYTFAPKPVKHT